MPYKLPENTKSLVIQQWLKGEQRDKIASESGFSAGAVTNIVNDWKQGLGFAVADELRELGVTLKKIGITPVQCAVGFRVGATMNRLGVKEEEFESFMINVYSHCKNLGLTPESIASYLTDLLEFSKSVPIAMIPDYIKSKKEEKEKLEKEIESMHDQIADLETQRSVNRDLLDIALHDEKVTTATLKWYSDIKEELTKHGIPVDDISKLANVISGIRQQGFDANKVIDEFSNLNMLRTECKIYQDNIPRLKVQYDTLNQSYLFLQQEVSSHNQSITAYRELEDMGFGLKELKLLWHTINEITDANNISPFESVKKFLKDIEEQYDDKLGFETKISKLQTEVNRLAQEEARLRSLLLVFPMVTPSLTRLLQRGVTEQNIVDIAGLLKDIDGGHSRIGEANENSGVTVQEVQSLINELRRHGSIKTTINQLTQKVEKLRNQADSLRHEKQNLNAQIQTILLTLHGLEQLASFYMGTSLSLKSEIASLISIIAYIVHALNSEVQRPPILQEDNSKPQDNRFVPLIMAAKDEEIDLAKLKSSLAEAIRVTQDKLGSGKLDEILSKGRLALLDNSGQA
jgi:hypothetical protein